MFPATGLIYYISERSIDQIYRSIYGPLDDARTTETRNERATSVAGKLGLDKLLALLTGATLSAEATVQRKKATSETFESRITTEDRAIRLLRDIFATESADISTIVDSENLLPLYTFSRPVNVSYRTVSSESNPLIEVSHSSPEIEFAGVTSPENWVSPSLLNNLLWKACRLIEQECHLPADVTEYAAQCLGVHPITRPGP